MICKKCGREYPDDMVNCLWCDAPNDHHVVPEPPEKIDLASALDVDKKIDTIILKRLNKNGCAAESEELEKKIDKHPAGDFMWCAAILGTGCVLSSLFAPFYIAFFHRTEIRKNHTLAKFTSVYISSTFALKFIVGKLSQVIRELLEKGFFREDIATLIRAFLELGVLLVDFVLCGYVAAFIIKRLTPDYEATEYKVTSISATIYSIPTVILLHILGNYLFKT